MAQINALGQFLPPPPPGAPSPFALSSPGRVEGLLRQAGLEPLTSDEVNCTFEFPNLETAVRGQCRLVQRHEPSSWRGLRRCDKQLLGL